MQDSNQWSSCQNKNVLSCLRGGVAVSRSLLRRGNKEKCSRRAKKKQNFTMNDWKHSYLLMNPSLRLVVEAERGSLFSVLANFFIGYKTKCVTWTTKASQVVDTVCTFRDKQKKRSVWTMDSKLTEKHQLSLFQSRRRTHGATMHHIDCTDCTSSLQYSSLHRQNQYDKQRRPKQPTQLDDIRDSFTNSTAYKNQVS